MSQLAQGLGTSLVWCDYNVSELFNLLDLHQCEQATCGGLTYLVKLKVIVLVLHKRFSCILFILINALFISVIGKLVSNRFNVLEKVRVLSSSLKTTETAVERC